MHLHTMCSKPLFLLFQWQWVLTSFSQVENKSLILATRRHELRTPRVQSLWSCFFRVHHFQSEIFSSDLNYTSWKHKKSIIWYFSGFDHFPIYPLAWNRLWKTQLVCRLEKLPLHQESILFREAKQMKWKFTIFQKMGKRGGDQELFGNFPHIQL